MYKFATWNKPTLIKFWTRIKIDPKTGCWIWQSTKTIGGYGAFWHDLNQFSMAHRYAYRTFIGEIPKGLMVCHKCDVRDCANPAHLFLGTALDNARDKMRKGRHRIWKNGELICIPAQS